MITYSKLVYTTFKTLDISTPDIDQILINKPALSSETGDNDGGDN